MVEKCIFLKVVKIPYPKNQFLVILRSISQRNNFSQGVGGYFLLLHSKRTFFNEKMSSLAGLKKKLFDFPQRYRFWPFLTTWVHIQGRFSQRTGKNSQNSSSISCRRFSGTLCQIFSFLSSKRCGGTGGRFASRHFPKSVFLASCSFLARPFVACYACSIIIFLFSY